jgi:protein-L-isoaspartate(D-aspartate) O-methyltransferase
MKEEDASLYEELRRAMVEEQIIARGIKDKRLLEVIAKVPRHLFVEPRLAKEAYRDSPLPIGYNQTISQPYMVALMTELLEIKGEEKILEIGTGSGYQAAILAELAKEIFTIEKIPELAREAKLRLEKLGYKNIYVKEGNGTLGLPEFAPFDRIIITAGAPSTPPPLLDQLKEHGIMVIPEGSRYLQELIVIRKEDKIIREKKESCVFVPLVGKYGWSEEEN